MRLTRSYVSRWVAAVVFVIVSVAALAWFLRENRNDDAYITYRYAQNLLAGRGYVFNPGERVLATTAPLHGLVLACMGLVSPDLVSNALVLSAASVVVLVLAVFVVVRDTAGTTAGVVAGGTLLFNRSTYELFPLETIFVAAVCWAGVVAAHRRHHVLLGVLAGVAGVIRLDALLCFVALGVVLLGDGRSWRDRLQVLVPAVLIVSAWLLFAHAYYGTPLPSTAATKTGWGGREWVYLSRLWDRGLALTFGVETASALAMGLAAWGAVVVFLDERLRVLRTVVVWIVLHVGAYTAMRIVWPHHWYYYPVTVGVIVLFAVGAVDLGRRIAARVVLTRRGAALIRWGLALSLIAAWASSVGELASFRRTIAHEFFVGGRDLLYRDLAQWLRANTDPDVRVAIAEPGTVAFYSDRTMVDLLGLVTPQVGVAMKHERGQALVRWVLDRFEPDYVVLALPLESRVPRTMAGAPQYVVRTWFARPLIEKRLVVYERSGSH